MKFKKYMMAMGTIVATGSSIAVAVSCGTKTNKNRIAFIKATDNSTYDGTLYTYGKKYAKAAGYELDEFSSAADNSKETSTINNVINSHKYKSIVFQPVNTQSSFDNLKLLLDAKLLVAVPDRIFSAAQLNTLSADQKKYMVIEVTSDNYEIAKQAGASLVKYWIDNKIINIDASNLNSKKVILIEGETASDSSLERVKGFKDYFDTTKSDGIKAQYPLATNIDISLLTGEWSTAVAQKQFDDKVKAIGDAGIGAFAANDQMAAGIVAGTAMRNIIKNMEYPITAVDANTGYKNLITNKADGKNDVQKRIIADYAQRTATTMKTIISSLLYAQLGKEFKGKTTFKYVLDSTKTINVLDHYIKDSFDSKKGIIKLTGVAVTRDKDGKIVNESALI